MDEWTLKLVGICVVCAIVLFFSSNHLKPRAAVFKDTLDPVTSDLKAKRLGTLLLDHIGHSNLHVCNYS